MIRMLASLPILVTLALLTCVAAITISRARDSDILLASFSETEDGHELIVHMRFEPEAFHMAELQRAGRIVGVDGTRVRLRAVEYEDLRQLSWKPWVQAFTPLPDAGQ